MPQRILDSTEATAGGIFTLLSTAVLKVYEWVTLDNVNNFVELALALGGGVFLYYRITKIKLENEGQKLDNQKKRKELEK